MDKLPTVVIDGVRVELDDLHHEVIVHGRRRPLRPQAYFLARRFSGKRAMQGKRLMALLAMRSYARRCMHQISRRCTLR